MHYLDNSATTKPLDCVCEAVLGALKDDFGNPSSLYGLGICAEKIVSNTREILGEVLGCKGEELYFTSCATESSNAIIFGCAEKFGRRKKRVVTTAVEHPSVAVAFDKLEKSGFEVVRIFPDAEGKITDDMIFGAVDDNTFLVSCMLVNNETGYVLPVERVFRRIKRKFPECITHCDAVQGFLKTEIKVNKLFADCISISGHKVHAPKGIGVMYIKKGVKIPPYLVGGGQEKGMRSGTESVPLIAGFGSAVKAQALTISERFQRAVELRNYLIKSLESCKGVELNSGENCLPYINSIAVLNIKSETLLHYLESREIYVSSGSACSKGKKSSVLKAFNIPENRLDSTIRVSFSAETDESDIDALVEGIKSAQAQLCKIK